MKAENREALILYGLLICILSAVWLATHGSIALVRTVAKNETQDSNDT